MESKEKREDLATIAVEWNEEGEFTISIVQGEKNLSFLSYITLEGDFYKKLKKIKQIFKWKNEIALNKIVKWFEKLDENIFDFAFINKITIELNKLELELE